MAANGASVQNPAKSKTGRHYIERGGRISGEINLTIAYNAGKARVSAARINGIVWRINFAVWMKFSVGRVDVNALSRLIYQCTHGILGLSEAGMARPQTAAMRNP